VAQVEAGGETARARPDADRALVAPAVQPGSLRSAVAGRELWIALEVLAILSWVVVRTVFGDRGEAYVVWSILTAVLAVVSPVSGLVVVAATAPFFEPATVTAVIGWRTLIVVALALGVGLRLLAGGWRTYPRAPVALAAVGVGVVTLAGVVLSFRRFDEEFATRAAASWLVSVGGAMLVLLAALWVFREGDRRPLYAGVGASVVAGVICLVEYFAPGSVSGSPVAWVGFWKDFGNRIAGVIASPNGVATLFVMPAAIVVAAALLGSEMPPRLRLVAALAAAPLLLALVLTLSRAALIAFLIFGVVFAWRIRRELGIGLLVLGIVGGIVLLPSYLQARSQLAPVEGAVEPGSVLVASDQYRLRAWGAASRMFLDDPLKGQGFLSYRRVAPEFGDRVLNSPHNEWLRLFAEEGIAGGLAGIALVGTALVVLRRASGWLGAGIFAGFLGYVAMASFNNPFLFIQISIVLFTAVAYGVATVTRARDGPRARSVASA
jgi:O-antigen ligase